MEGSLLGRQKIQRFQLTDPNGKSLYYTRGSQIYINQEYKFLIVFRVYRNEQFRLEKPTTYFFDFQNPKVGQDEKSVPKLAGWQMPSPETTDFLMVNIGSQYLILLGGFEPENPASSVSDPRMIPSSKNFCIK